MRVQRVGDADQAAIGGIDVLDGDVAVGAILGAAGIGQLGIGVGDQVDAVGGGDAHAAIGIGAGLDPHHLGQLVQRHLLLVQKTAGMVAADRSGLDLAV